MLNSRGLEVAGIGKDTPDPEGGHYGRADGELTGFVAENALDRVHNAGTWPEITREVRRQGVALMSRAMAASGLTSTTYAHYHGNKWVDYGPEKMQWMFAHKSFLDYGIPVAPASDYTPGPFEPLMAIQSMVDVQVMCR